MSAQLQLDMERDAVFSTCRTWRYALYRVWDRDAGLVQFVGLNPSTADESIDDPTVRRCIRFARDWGYGGLVMTNLYGFRATDPRDLHAAEEPVGPGTRDWLAVIRSGAVLCVAAWGADVGPYPEHPGRVRRMLGVFGPLHVLGFTKHGAPRHPLYMRADCKPEPWSPA